MRNGFRQLSIGVVVLGMAGTGASVATACDTDPGHTAAEWIYGCSRHAPTVLTGDATVTRVPGSGSTPPTATVTFSARVDPNRYATTARFQYGTRRLSSNTGSQSAGSGDHPVTVSASVTGLRLHTTYRFRVVATSAAGTTYGSTETITTP